MKKAFDFLFKVCPAEWEETINKMQTEDKELLLRSIESIGERAALLSGYLHERIGYGCGDQGHIKAVKEANKRAKKFHVDISGFLGYLEIHF